MRNLAKVFGVLFMLAGAWILIAPEQLTSMADWESQESRYGAAAMRVVVGLILILAASGSRLPRVLRVLGIVALVIGLVIAILPLDVWVDLVRIFTVDHPELYRFGGGTVAILFGAFIVYAVSPGSESA